MANVTSASPLEPLHGSVDPALSQTSFSKVQADLCGQDLSLVAVPWAPGTPLDREPQVLSGDTQTLAFPSTLFRLEFWMRFVCTRY